MLSLILLFVTVALFLMTDWSEAYVAIERGQQVLERVRTQITRYQSTKALSVGENKDDDDDDADQIRIGTATFRWDRSSRRSIIEQPLDSGDKVDSNEEFFELYIENFRLPKAHNNVVIGICGTNSTDRSSLIQALLGQMPLVSGSFHCVGRVAYYPQNPYILADDATFRQNICWPEVHAFDERHYKECLATVQLCLSDGRDLQCIDRTLLDAELQCKIGLARSLYNTKEETILLEISRQANVAYIFEAVVAKLMDLGKSVIVLSNDDKV